MSSFRRSVVKGPDATSAEALQRWLSYQTFWFVAGVVAVVLLPFTAVWVAKQAWVIAAATGGGLLAIAWCAWQVKRNPRAQVERYTWSILVVEFLAMAANSWLQGGSDAPALRWMAIIPCIAIAAGAYRTGLLMTGAFALQVLVMHHYQPAYLAVWRHHVLPSPENQRLFAVIVPVGLFAFFGLFTTMWRRRVLDALEGARQQARQGEVAKERFLATMSHEIRTPLNGVIGTLSLLQGRRLEAEQQAQLVSLATNSAQSLMRLLNDVLDWSKLDAQQIELQWQPVSLHGLVQDALDLFAVAAATKHIELLCELSPQVPETIISDESRLRQIVLNLLANAVKFTPQGRVVLRVTCGEVRADGRCDLSLSISDSGIGMTELQMARLFKPFVQGDQAITRQFGGTGLGLAICQELAVLLGGRISVTSVQGQGSCFVLHWTAKAGSPANSVSHETDPMTSRDQRRQSLMLAVAQAGAGASTSVGVPVIESTNAAAGAGDQPRHVLVADDNPTNVLILKEMLTLQGCACSHVMSGPDALAACARSRPDALFLDYQMPGMDGLSVVQALRRKEAEQGAAPMPIVLVSGDVPLRSREAWLAQGVDEVLSKPIDFEALSVICARLIGVPRA